MGEEPLEPVDGGDVELIGGLIEEQHIRLQDQGLSQQLTAAASRRSCSPRGAATTSYTVPAVSAGTSWASRATSVPGLRVMVP